MKTMYSERGTRMSGFDGGISMEYLSKHFFSADGVAHVRRMGEEPMQKSKGRHFAHTDEDIENIKKCLSCKRKDCTGGAACFRKGVKA